MPRLEKWNFQTVYGDLLTLQEVDNYLDASLTNQDPMSIVFVTGFIYEDDRFNSGTDVRTSPVKNYYYNGKTGQVQTKNTLYTLGKYIGK